MQIKLYWKKWHALIRLEKKTSSFFTRLLTKQTTKLFFKASKKRNPSFLEPENGRVESYFHSCIILYSKLSLMWPGGKGGECEWQRAAGPGSLPVVPACRKPARALPPAFTSLSQPGAGPGVRSTRTTAGGAPEKRGRRGRRPGPRNPSPPAAAPRPVRPAPSVGEGPLQQPPLPEREARGCGAVTGRAGSPPPRRVGRRALPARYHSAGPGRARLPPLRPLCYTLTQ